MTILYGNYMKGILVLFNGQEMSLLWQDSVEINWKKKIFLKDYFINKK